MGEERVISEPISREYYWLCNLINKFHYHGGLEMITDTICLPKTNLAVSSYLYESFLTWETDISALYSIFIHTV